MLPATLRIPALNLGGIFLSGVMFSILMTASAAAAPVREAHTEVELLAEDSSIQPGRKFWAALRLTPDKGWHTYWKNPGDAGLATSIKWNLPAGLTAGDLQWPVPHKITGPAGVSYGYEGEVLLLTQMTAASDLKSGAPVRITGQVRWVACEEICVWGKTELALELPVKNEVPQPDESRQTAFENARRMLPVSAGGWNFSAAVSGKQIILKGESPADKTAMLPGLYFFSAERGALDPAFEQRASVRGTRFELALRRPAGASGKLQRLKGVLGAPAAAEGAGAVEVDLAL